MGHGQSDVADVPGLPGPLHIRLNFGLDMRDVGRPGCVGPVCGTRLVKFLWPVSARVVRSGVHKGGGVREPSCRWSYRKIIVFHKLVMFILVPKKMYILIHVYIQSSKH